MMCLIAGFCWICRLLIADASLLLLLLRVVVMCFTDCTNGIEMGGSPCGLATCIQ
jgi:hypothetical protein